MTPLEVMKTFCSTKVSDCSQKTKHTTKHYFFTSNGVKRALSTAAGGVPLKAVIFIITLVVAVGVWPTSQAQAALFPRRIDGVWLSSGSGVNRWPVAVMIDNHPQARPQAGLNQASVVYETLAEGGIPRFMAVYAQKDITLIGPVRSTRPYFVRHAAEYGAAIAHAGGSPDGLKAVRDYRLLSLEGIKGQTAKYFFRRGSGVHSLYTNGGQLQRALRDYRLANKVPTYRPWKFKVDAKLNKRPLGKHGANIDLGGGRSFIIRYEFDRARNVYVRFTGGTRHRDKLTKRQLFAHNVIIQLVPKERVLDRKGRLDINNVGQGKAVILQDGKARTIVWKKPTPRSRTVFYEMNGRETRLNRGSTWITILPKGRKYNLF